MVPSFYLIQTCFLLLTLNNKLPIINRLYYRSAQTLLKHGNTNLIKCFSDIFLHLFHAFDFISTKSNWKIFDKAVTNNVSSWGERHLSGEMFGCRLSNCEIAKFSNLSTINVSVVTFFGKKERADQLLTRYGAPTVILSLSLVCSW